MAARDTGKGCVGCLWGRERSERTSSRSVVFHDMLAVAGNPTIPKKIRASL